MEVGLGELRELVMDREAWLLRFMGSKRVGHDWATELNWAEGKHLRAALSVYAGDPCSVPERLIPVDSSVSGAS